MFYGLVAGLFMDLFYSGPFGFYTLFFINLGYVSGICNKYYYEDYITLPLLLSLASDLIYNLYIYVFRFLIRNRLNFGHYLVSIIIPEIIFTTVTTLVVYRFFLFINRKLKEWEQRRDSNIVDDLKEYLREWFKKVITSRLFVLAVVFCLMSSALVMRLFNLQIIKGEEYQDAYTAMTEKVIKTASTRGNIYDRNGNVLAYNELAYDVTIQDTGAYKTECTVGTRCSTIWYRFLNKTR